MFLGAAAAAVLGLGLGAWLTPPPTGAADPDPYENVVVTPPAEALGASYGPIGAGWTPVEVSAAPDSPDSRIELADPGGRAAEPVAWSQPWDAPPAEADQAALRRLDEALPPPADGRPSWPSARGDILAVETPAAPADPPSPPEPVQARSQDPRDWDVPATAYRRSGFEMRPQLAATASPIG